jgi:hypothetical protein
MRTSGDLRLTVVEFLFRQEAEYGGRTFSLFLQIGILLRASIYGEKKFKFLLDLLDPKNQQKSIQYLEPVSTNSSFPKIGSDFRI